MGGYEALSALPLRQQLKLLADRRISATELVTASIERAEAIDEATSAFLTIAGEAALEAAGHIDKAYAEGRSRSILQGIPVPLKDNVQTRGIRTTYGSALFADNVPARDSSSVENLKAAGAIIIGKTNMSAFGHLDVTENLLRPPASNPLRLSCSPGGSSGGAAIAVAAGVSRIAHGGDGSGSVRIPASLCGIVGLKPTYGHIPNWPTGDLWSARTTQGILGRSVDDVAFGMAAIAGPNDYDPLCNHHVERWLHYADVDTRAIGRGVYIAQFGSDKPTNEVAAVCERAANSLCERGLEIEEVAIDITDTHDWYTTLWQVPLAQDMRSHLGDRRHLMETSLIELVERGLEIPAFEYFQARQKRSQIHQRMVEKLQGVSFLLTPTLPTSSWPKGQLPEVGSGREPRFGACGSRWENLYIFNALGWPAISVPCGVTSDGSPVGLQIAARRYDDLLCLKIASLVEEFSETVKCKWEIREWQ